MREFIDIAIGFPAVVWTVPMLISLGFWLLSTAFGADGMEVDGDGATDLIDTLSVLGLAHAPVSVVITFLTLVGWLFTTLAISLVGPDVSVLVGIVVLVISVAVAVPATGRLATLIGPLYSANRGLRHSELIGRICVVRTGRVDGGFGQAEVIDEEGSSHLLQIRYPAENELRRGSRALIIDVDDGVFRVDPDLSGLGQ